MKVETKIVPVEVEEKSGWFTKKKKTMHQLQWFITLTEVEKAIINKAGFRDYSYLDKDWTVTTKDGPYSETHHFPIYPWVDKTNDNWGRCEYDTLFEAQTGAQKIKAALSTLKQAMDAHTSTPTDDSYEL